MALRTQNYLIGYTTSSGSYKYVKNAKIIGPFTQMDLEIIDSRSNYIYSRSAPELGDREETIIELVPDMQFYPWFHLQVNGQIVYDQKFIFKVNLHVDEKNEVIITDKVFNDH